LPESSSLAGYWRYHLLFVKEDGTPPLLFGEISFKERGQEGVFSDAIINS
jgi:hypothetical protein